LDSLAFAVKYARNKLEKPDFINSGIHSRNYLSASIHKGLGFQVVKRAGYPMAALLKDMSIYHSCGNI